MKAKGSWWWMGCFLIFLLAVPSFVRADVTIDTAETSMVDLEDRNVGTGRNAYVTDTGSVNTSDYAAVLTNANGWNVNVSELGKLSGESYGVLFDDDGNNPYLNGTLTNYGSIYGGTHGTLMNYGTITNYGSLMAGIGSGAFFSSEGTGTATVNNSGTMSGGDNGLEFYNLSTGTMTAIVTNNINGTMSGYYNGIKFYSAGAGIATITNSGTIEGTDEGDGVYLESDGALTTRIQNNLGGTIDGSGNGIYFESLGAGNVQITNAGEITGENGSGIYLNSDGPFTATITNTGTIQSFSNNAFAGVYIVGNDEIETPVGSVNLINSDKIWSQGYGLDIECLGAATITNSGSIYAEDYYGAYLNSIGTATITNNAGGEIYGYQDGIHLINIGIATAYNAGFIYSEDDDGIHIQSVDTATVNNSGLIEGLYSYDSTGGGIYVYDAGAATVNNQAGGRIYADYATGIYMEWVDEATINNTGLIQGDYSFDWKGGGVAVVSADTATVNNLAGGQIIGSNAEGIYMEYIDTATVNNAGWIYGYMDGIGIEYVNEATITNSGMIQSGYDDYDYAGVYISR